MPSSKKTCWINGKVLAADEAKISIFDHGLLYGDGVFEGLRYYSRNVFKMREHLRRLKLSADALMIPLPWPDELLQQAILNVIDASGTANGYIRLIVTRGSGSLGIDPRHCTSPTVIIIASAFTLVDERKKREGIRLLIAAHRRSPADVLDSRIKSLNYLNNIMAKIQANIAGMDEALLLNELGYIAEGSTDNIFIIKDDILYTPCVSDGALDGITRSTVIKIATDMGIKALEVHLTAYDLYTADECFLTGTGVELLPVSAVDGRKISGCPGEIFSKIETAFFKLVVPGLSKTESS